MGKFVPRLMNPVKDNGNTHECFPGFTSEIMMNHRLNRTEMTSRYQESWRPPPFQSETGLIRQILARLRRFLDLQAGSIWMDLHHLLQDRSGVILDVGCGAQPYRCLISPQAQYRGIDRAEVGDHFGYSIPDVDYYHGDRWPVQDSSCDTILATETLEHVLDPEQFLAEARRCLRPQGQLLITVPFAARWHYIPYDYWRFTPSSLKVLFNKTGFGTIEIYARGNEVTVACYKVMALILPLLVSPGTGMIRVVCQRLLGIVLSPLLIGLALVANGTLYSQGGDDCLGYTVIAHP